MACNKILWLTRGRGVAAGNGAICRCDVFSFATNIRNAQHGLAPEEISLLGWIPNKNLHYLFLLLFTVLAQVTHAEFAPADPARYVTHELKISGVIEHEITLSLADLQKMPQQNIATVAQECAKNLAGLKKKGYQGVLLRDLLANISINNADKKAWKRAYLVVHASDDYVAVFSWNEIFNSEVGDAVLIADAANDKPLPDAVGKIALISGCDLRTGARHVKWLNEIEIRLVVSL